jgi:Ca-activated chloride channel homolog
MTFEAPYLLVSLVAVPAAAIAYLVIEARRARRSAAWSRPTMLPNVARQPSHGLRHLPFMLFLLGLTFLLVGFARPERLINHVRAVSPTIVLAIDVSGSMAATDVHETRILLAREVATQFLHDLPAKYDVALLTFGNKVRVVVPATTDRKLLIGRLPAKVTPRAGTSIGDAITAAVSAVTQNVDRTAPQNGYPGVMLLLSDGAQTGPGTSPGDASEIAYADRVPVDSVAIGTGKGSVTQPITVDGFKTSTNIPVAVAAAALKTIAKQTVGVTFPASSPAQVPAVVKELRKVFEGLGPPVLTVHKRDQLSGPAGVIAFALVVAGIVLSTVYFGRLA